jgi:hypothetical protein
MVVGSQSREGNRTSINAVRVHMPIRAIGLCLVSFLLLLLGLLVVLPWSWLHLQNFLSDLCIGGV